MPFYRFVCPKCGYKDKILLSPSKLEVFSKKCLCGTMMVRSLGIPASRELETTDEYRNKSQVAGVDRMIEDRAKENFVKEQLPKMIDEHGIDYVKANGHVDEDGRPT